MFNTIKWNDVQNLIVTGVEPSGELNFQNLIAT